MCVPYKNETVHTMHMYRIRKGILYIKMAPYASLRFVLQKNETYIISFIDQDHFRIDTAIDEYSVKGPNMYLHILCSLCVCECVWCGFFT